jgi:imidazolonepropionase-like amidohydrolase
MYVRAGRVIDALGGPPLDDAVVSVQDGRIVAVQRAAEVADLETAEVRHFPDGTLLPGLVDAHTHLSLAGDSRSYEHMMLDTDAMMALVCIRNMQLHLAGGVTTLRDNGARNQVTFTVREAMQRGYFSGPRLLLSGRPITHSGGHFHFCNEVADGAEALRRSVRRLVAEGADHIKIMASGGATAGNLPFRASYSTDELRAAVETAHGLGRLTTAHCRARDAMEYAVDAGLDCIEHAEFLVAPSEVTLGSGVVPPGEMRYDERLAERMLRSGLFVSFTFQAGGYDSLVDLRQQRAQTPLDAAQQRELDRLERYYEQKLAIFERLLRDGFEPRLVVSSDAGPFDCQFGRMHYGLELAAQGGMSPMQAIRSMTAVAAEACGVAALVGTLEPGKCADLLVVRGDPLADLARMSDVLAVFKDGILAA